MLSRFLRSLGWSAFLWIAALCALVAWVFTQVVFSELARHTVDRAMTYADYRDSERIAEIAGLLAMGAVVVAFTSIAFVLRSERDRLLGWSIPSALVATIVLFIGIVTHVVVEQSVVKLDWQAFDSFDQYQGAIETTANAWALGSMAIAAGVAASIAYVFRKQLSRVQVCM